jgi:hypothetical protein
VRGTRGGPAADFAAAITRVEFGRFYVDEARLREARQSVDKAIARRRSTPRPKPASAEAEADIAPAGDAARAAKPASCVKQLPWKMPSVRERRTEIATALKRLRRKRRSPGGGAPIRARAFLIEALCASIMERESCSEYIE